MVKNYPTWNVHVSKIPKKPVHHRLIHCIRYHLVWINYASSLMVPVFLLVVIALTYPPVKLRQLLLNSLTYLGVHKPIFALVHDEGL